MTYHLLSIPYHLPLSLLIISPRHSSPLITHHSSLNISPLRSFADTKTTRPISTPTSSSGAIVLKGGAVARVSSTENHSASDGFPVLVTLQPPNTTSWHSAFASKRKTSPRSSDYQNGISRFMCCTHSAQRLRARRVRATLQKNLSFFSIKELKSGDQVIR